jgi:hypothetical protein
VVLAACGTGSPGSTADANNNGGYISAGDVTYQLQVSRELNPYNNEDQQYLVGVSSPTLAAGQEWYAVFLWAKNQTHRDQTTTDSFDIVDTENDYYYPVAINSAVNPFAWTAQTLAPNGSEPAVGSIAAFGPTQGQELLFKVNQSVYSNRPLTLEIHLPGQTAVAATISLDL